MKKYFLIIIILSAVTLIGIAMSHASFGLQTGSTRNKESVQTLLQRNGWKVTETVWVSESDVSGLRVIERVFAEHDDAHLQVALTRYQIDDAALFEQALRDPLARVQRVGSREGTVLPVAGLVPASLWVTHHGNHLYSIEYGVQHAFNFMEWDGSPVPSEITALIDLLPVE